MNILEINSNPIFQIVTRKNLTSWDLTMILVNESSGKSQTIPCTAYPLSNENYNLEMSIFPIGKANDKFSYTLLNDDEVLSLGKIMIVSQGEVVQDFSKKSVNKYYK